MFECVFVHIAEKVPHFNHLQLISREIVFVYQTCSLSLIHSIICTIIGSFISCETFPTLRVLLLIPAPWSCRHSIIYLKKFFVLFYWTNNIPLKKIKKSWCLFLCVDFLLLISGWFLCFCLPRLTFLSGNLRRILERQTAVQEILESNSHTLTSVQSLLARLPDLDRGICSIYHKRVSAS